MTEELADRVIYWAVADSESTNSPVVIAASTPGWEQDLGRAHADPTVERVVVVVEHLLSRLFVDLLRRRRPRRITPFAVRGTMRTLRDSGWDCESAYLIWPSAQQPRVAIPKGQYRLASWMQRSGVLGGGRSMAARAVLRSRAATPLTPMTARATAIVADRRHRVA